MFHIIIIWMLFVIPPFVFSADDKLHRLCSQPFSCGDQTGLLYPFWIAGREDSGHPVFKVNCSGGFAELSISSVKFRILEANYDSGIIRLARSDFIGGLCPKNLLNATFDESVLTLAPSTEFLTIYHDCRQAFPQYVSTYVGDLPCGDGDGDDDDTISYYVTTNLSSPLLNGIRGQLEDFGLSCKSASVRISGPWLDELQKNRTRDNLQRALAEGFQLGLNQECSSCLASKGACGFNQNSGGSVCYCKDEPNNRTCSSRKKDIDAGRLSTGAIAGLATGVIMFLLLVLALFLQLIRKRNKKAFISQPKIKALIPLKQYSYAQVKRITKSFAEVVGRGGFGTVYRGTLPDGRKVAVKVLKDSKGYSGEDFINEVASISQTSHINIVTLLGFCYEGSKRAILYEFLENGSLDKLITSKRPSIMDWRDLYGVALGVARGLEYLHHGCRTRIVHFDIKPQNVLLDHNLCPKVSDFGLAKLCEKKESILSLLDTRGFRNVKPHGFEIVVKNKIQREQTQPFRCGDQTGLSYPFWTLGREDCGHPEFEVDCSGGFAELSITSVKFRILEANYDSGIIRLARSDFIGGLCPKDLSNATFDESVLPPSPTTERLTIYHDCRQAFPPYVSTYVGDLPCGDGDDTISYYVTTNLSSPLLNGIRGQLDDFRSSCKSVSIPASGPWLETLQRNRTPDNLQKALAEGFQVGLNQDCSSCSASEGACGFNQNSGGFVCYSLEGANNRARKKGLSTGAIAGLAAGVILFLLLVLALFLQLIRKRNKKAFISQPKLKALIPLKQYSYAQVKRITNSFAEVVGRGGFGTVYRGTLPDGRKVAVKVLKDSKGYSGEDFINEVASISQTSHINIVTLLGFCYEGSKRAILYEFLENGSLDKLITSKRPSIMGWRDLYGVALGVARGLEYLHHGCRTRIVHFDIKPQNVLLDHNLCPKVSDFGLAKLCEKKESILSLLDTRGTIGYIAPELFSRMYGRVSHKSDVYSYGMLVLEMIGARNKDRDAQEVGTSTSSMYFPEWIYKDLEMRGSGSLMENGVSSEEEEMEGPLPEPLQTEQTPYELSSSKAASILKRLEKTGTKAKEKDERNEKVLRARVKRLRRGHEKKLFGERSASLCYTV
ncbi:hypothetical protein F2Q68_00045986 [Brassica cretica]|uniref:non-specific serine/threonine protein kinase n=1 Tax=Brassica cretica TaxID=69181 RepID=A0A8S9LGD4_BRACR|nr:hypothetical protein F2Q68_00045986 [Brassica cretica]